MKRLLFFPFIFLFSVSVIQAADAPKSLVVMLDGVRSDAQRMAKTPNIDALMDGSWASGYKGSWTFTASTIRDAPTVSAPNHTAIATGVTAEKNRVKDNGVFADYNKTQIDGVYRNYLARIKTKYPGKKVAFVYSWKPDEILVQANNPCDLVVQNKDDANAKLVPTILDSTFNSETWTQGTDVDAVLFYIDLPDAAGHAGGFSPPGTKHDGYLKSIETCDSWIGDALTAIRKRPNFSSENWQIIICSDHGGWVSSHGAARADNYTVPLVVSSKNVIPGKMPGQPCTTDIAVTVLDHFGFDTIDLKRRGLLDGSLRGKTAGVSNTKKSLDDGLIVFLPFEGNVDNKAANSAIKATNNSATIKSDGGKKGGYLEIRSSDEQTQYVTLGNPEKMELGADGNMSVAFWMRVPGKSDADPAIFSNKNWESGKNSGINLFIAGEDNGGGNNLSLNIADKHQSRVDVKQLNMTPSQWWFCALTIDRKSNATLYAGSPEGKLYFCSMSLVGESLGVREWVHGDMNSSLPWNLGTDGTGNYKVKLNADLDEFRIWNRCLEIEEIETIFQKSSL